MSAQSQGQKPQAQGQKEELKIAPKAAWPVRAWIQQFDDVPPDYVLVVAELKARGIPVLYKRTEDILRQPWAVSRDDLVVGNFEWTRLALEKLRIAMPQPPDYPVCLRHLLQRRVWQSTLGEVRTFLKREENKGSSVFIKPAATAKAFAAIIEPRDQMLDTLLDGIPEVLEGLPRSTPVHCSELVDMVAEYRVYVVQGTIRAICQYRGPRPPAPEAAALALNLDVAKEAVRLLSESAETRDLTGYGVDFAVVKKREKGVDSYSTCLVEVNDGYSLGRYEGLSGKDYTDLLIARWGRVVGKT